MHRLWGQASANQREFIDPLAYEHVATAAGLTAADLDLIVKQAGAVNGDGIGDHKLMNRNTVEDGHNLYGSRWYGYHQNNPDVTNNLSEGMKSEVLAGRFLQDTSATASDPRLMDMKRGRYGKTVYDFSQQYKSNEPWKALNSHDDPNNGLRPHTSPNDPGTVDFSTNPAGLTSWGWGSPTYETRATFGSANDPLFSDNGYFDSSWELGKPLLGTHVDPRQVTHTQQDQRWFEGINNHASAGNPAADSTTDDARMHCFTCEVQYQLHWNSDEKRFYMTDSTGASKAWASGSGDLSAWGECEQTGTSQE